jgi:glycosyltransferase involved in cell wall biosynthesis
MAAPSDAPAGETLASASRIAPGLPPLSLVQARGVEALLGQLSIDLPPERVLAGLARVLDGPGRSALGSLLSMLGAEEPQVARAPGLPRVCRARDLPAVPPRGLPLNVLFVSWEFPNPIHAGGEWVAEFIRGLGPRHNVHLYTWYLEDRDRAALEAIRPFCREVITASAEEFLAPADRRLAALAASVGFDIVHYKWPNALRRRRRGLGHRQVFSYVEAVSLSLHMDLAQAGPQMSVAWLEHLGRVILALHAEVVETDDLDAHVVVTRKDAEFLARFCPYREYAVVNTGVRIDEFALPDRPPDPATLAFVGNYLHYPNEDAMLFFLDRIFPAVLARVPEAKLLVIGAGPTPRLLARHDGERVLVTGRVDDVRPYLQRAAVCIAPLVSGAGIRNKVNQYSALKRPSVVTSIAATDLSYRDGHDILVADDPVRFADRVVHLLQHGEDARAMGARAFDTVSRDYDTTGAVDALDRLYHRLVSAGPTSSVEAP